MISRKNRKDQTWYLFEGKTKLGKPKYFLSQSKSSEGARLATSVPDGYELYETPAGQVFCRKKLPALITDDEVAVVKRELAKHNKANCIVDRKGKELIIHEPISMGNIRELTGLLGVTISSASEYMKKIQRYQPILRFLLMDEKKRVFSVFRWCFRGAIDGWYPLDYTKPLEKLASAYVKHIGKESFYELI